MTKIYATAHDDQNPPRFAHFRSNFVNHLTTKLTPHNKLDHSFGGFTVAYNPSLIRRKDGTFAVFLEYAVAPCHGRDRFVKAKGREIALRNFNQRTVREYDVMYLGEGVVGDASQPIDIPLLANIQGDVYVNESQFHFRAVLASLLNYNDLY